ncbi:HET-domain-containing protein [Phaeosphaeriaceae sp. SRC1lsM3a]|nr:HET-domain-containing protein [Stagonospora sp. SRC1lsM3a]
MSEHAQPRVLDPLNLKLIQSWLADCLNNTNTAETKDPGNHDICNHTRQSRFAPTRVLDLGAEGLQSDLRLTTRRKLEKIYENITSSTCSDEDESNHTAKSPQRSKRKGKTKKHKKKASKDKPFAYVTMTHRWTGNVLKTTQASLSQHLAKIPFDSLSTTFQEGVMLARQLGYRYLWIDSLCIIQDFADDWASESEIMCDVYMNAVLNIADATPSPLEHRKLQQTDRFSGRTDNRYEFYAGQLESRGWVLQERIVAPATLYYCAPDQIRCWHDRYRKSVVWICRAAYYECGCDYERPGEWGHMNMLEVDGRKGKSHLSQVSKDLVASPAKSIANDEWWLRKWQKLVDWYSRRELTVESDRLPALSGLARHFAHGAQLPYAAGLWLDWMRESLLWTAEQPVKKPTTYLAPSWSWASLLSQVHYSAYSYEEDSWGTFDPKVFPDYVSCDIQLASSNRFGALSPEGPNALHLKGRLVEVTLQPSSKKSQELGFSPFAVTLEENSSFDHTAWLDFCSDEVPALGSLYLLLVTFCELTGYVALLLEVQDEAAHIYRRIGICDRGIKDIRQWERAAPIVLTII